MARALLAELRSVSALVPAEQRPSLLLSQEALETLVRTLERSALEDPESLSPSLAQRQQFGRRLRDLRIRAGFSRLELGRRAKLSDVTLKHLETFKHKPSRSSLLRLLEVPALGLTWEDVAHLVPGEPRPHFGEEKEPPGPAPVAVQSPLDPSCDPLRLSREHARLLNGPGGPIEQYRAYLDPLSAADYQAALQQTAACATLRESVPLGLLSQRILAQAESKRLHLLALGSDDGALVVRLAQHLLAPPRSRGLNLGLVDLSQPLLWTAHKRASEALGGNSGVRLFPLHAGLQNLPSEVLGGAALSAGSLRVHLMLGNTLGDLEDESRFLRFGLLPSAPGDLLLLDVPQAAASPEQPAEIRRHDPLWLQGLSPSQQTWLSGPLHRSIRDVTEVRFAWRLDPHGSLPGSYALEALATVRTRGRAERTFSVFRFKRYDAEQLISFLAAWGWSCVAQLPYGPDLRPTAALLLFRRQAESS